MSAELERLLDQSPCPLCGGESPAQAQAADQHPTSSQVHPDMALPSTPGACTVPPAGWRCTRAPGHEGPCAAWPAGAQPEGAQAADWSIHRDDRGFTVTDGNGIRAISEEDEPTLFRFLAALAGKAEARHFARQAAAPGALDADEMTRLRRLMAALGHTDAFEQPADYVRGILFTLLGQAAGKLERATNESDRAQWTTKQWYEHVGAWETPEGHIAFGSVMALGAMLIQFQRAHRPPAAPTGWTKESITDLAKTMAQAVAKNADTIPELTFPHIYLGLMDVLLPAPPAPAAAS